MLRAASFDLVGPAQLAGAAPAPWFRRLHSGDARTDDEPCCLRTGAQVTSARVIAASLRCRLTGLYPASAQRDAGVARRRYHCATLLEVTLNFIAIGAKIAGHNRHDRRRRSQRCTRSTHMTGRRDLTHSRRCGRRSRQSPARRRCHDEETGGARFAVTFGGTTETMSARIRAAPTSSLPPSRRICTACTRWNQLPRRRRHSARFPYAQRMAMHKCRRSGRDGE